MGGGGGASECMRVYAWGELRVRNTLAATKTARPGTSCISYFHLLLTSAPPHARALFARCVPGQRVAPCRVHQYSNEAGRTAREPLFTVIVKVHATFHLPAACQKQYYLWVGMCVSQKRCVCAFYITKERELVRQRPHDTDTEHPLV